MGKASRDKRVLLLLSYVISLLFPELALPVGPLLYRISITAKQKKKDGVLEVPLSSFKLMKSLTFLKVQDYASS